MRSRAVAHALLDVVARDHEVLAVIADAAHDQMDVGMLGVPVIDRDPIEPRAEILFHLADKIACEGLEVRHLRGVVGRDDEAEMMAIVLTSPAKARPSASSVPGPNSRAFSPSRVTPSRRR
jgi:hypothetical protein